MWYMWLSIHIFFAGSGHCIPVILSMSGCVFVYLELIDVYHLNNPSASISSAQERRYYIQILKTILYIFSSVIKINSN